jgi:hypothetical protein
MGPHFDVQAAYFASAAGSALPGGPGMTMAPGEVPPLTPPGGNVGVGGGGEVGENVGGGGITWGMPLPGLLPPPIGFPAPSMPCLMHATWGVPSA